MLILMDLMMSLFDLVVIVIVVVVVVALQLSAPD